MKTVPFTPRGAKSHPSGGFGATELLVASLLVALILVFAYRVVAVHARQSTRALRESREVTRVAHALSVIARDVRLSGSNPDLGPGSPKIEDTQFTVNGIEYPFGLDPHPSIESGIPLLAAYRLNFPFDEAAGLFHVVRPVEWESPSTPTPGDRVRYALQDRDGDGRSDDLVREDLKPGLFTVLLTDVAYVEVEFRTVSDEIPFRVLERSVARIRVTPDGREGDELDVTAGEHNQIARLLVNLAISRGEGVPPDIHSGGYIRKWVHP